MSKQFKNSDLNSEELSMFLSIIESNDRTYDYYMSSGGDDEWSFAQEEGFTESRHEWAKQEDEFYIDFGYPSHFFNSPTVLKGPIWLIHFTDVDPSIIANEGFIGRNADILGLTTNFKEGTNLGRLALAFKTDRVGGGGRSDFGKYGKNAVLFQVTEAVSAYHIGDEEHQIVFDVKDSFNYHTIYGNSDALILKDSSKNEIISVNRSQNGLNSILSILTK
jgi:hypothetical protein